MAGLMAVLFLGTIGLTQVLAIVAGPEETILSALVGGGEIRWPRVYKKR